MRFFFGFGANLCQINISKTSFFKIAVKTLGNSRFVFSNQTAIHPNLEKVLRRHLATPFQKKPLDFNRHAFDLALQAWKNFDENAPLVLDSVCGTGESTVFWANQNPQCFVLGVEKSQNRLNRHNAFKENLPQNCAFIRADVVDFWRLLADFLGANRRHLHRHYLLYPNPYPKAQHLQRRFHGNAVFPFLMQLGGRFECRTNWQTYAIEMAFSLEFLISQNISESKNLGDFKNAKPKNLGNFENGKPKICAEPFMPESPISAFERKYLESGHSLWRVLCDFSKK